MGKNKRYNRKSEQMYEQLETLGVMAELKGLEYPAGVIKRGWDIILLNQFHDIIPGSAIGPVYEQTDREYEEILKSGAETALHLAEGMGSRICGQDKDTRREEPEEQKPEEQKIIVFNTQGYEREDTVTVSGVAQGRRHMPATAWDTGLRSSMWERIRLYFTQRGFLPAVMLCTALWGQRIV